MTTTTSATDRTEWAPPQTAATADPGNPANSDNEDVVLVARGIATAASPRGGITELQASLLQAVTRALTGVDVDYRDLAPLGPDELAAHLADRDDHYRQRIVHHMVLAEIVLRPLPDEVARRVAAYAAALGVDDDFVSVARSYADGAHDTAWEDLRRGGFTDRLRTADTRHLRTAAPMTDPFEPQGTDHELADRWAAFEGLRDGTLGRRVWEMYDGRGFPLPGTPDGASAYLAQHDFVHVLADYGTNLKGELEVFALIGRADPDPKGFAWLATLVGLFETGYVADAGFFQSDLNERNVAAPGMNVRIADAWRRGKHVSERFGIDLLAVDYHALAARPVEEVRSLLHIPAKSVEAVDAGSAGLFDWDGMSERQRDFVTRRLATAA